MTDDGQPDKEQIRLRNMIRECITCCAYGIMDKSGYDPETRAYVYSVNLKTGLAKLQHILLLHGDEKARVEAVGITDSRFIHDYAPLPANSWFEHCDEQVRTAIDAVEQDLVGVTLARVYGTGEMEPTEACLKLLANESYATNDIIEDYDAIRSLFTATQSQYAICRWFYTTHPLLTVDEYGSFVVGEFPDGFFGNLHPGESEIAFLSDQIGRHYQSVASTSDLAICNNCGWTAMRHGNGIACASPSCRKHNGTNFSLLESLATAYPKKAFRLKRGIVRYVTVPGQLELAIARTLDKAGMAYEWWPEMDTADFLVRIDNGRTLAIDAKDYGDIGHVPDPAEDIFLSRLRADVSVYVVPDTISGRTSSLRDGIRSGIVSLAQLDALLTAIGRGVAHG